MSENTDGLKQFIMNRISQNGAMSIAEYMDLALGHPDYGYYMTRDPFGVDGDFTTAPEISQMFGEIIGAWIADQWFQHEQPAEFTILECGPGRGTLMADILRIGETVPGFLDAAHIVLMETSPVLRAAQEETLAEYNIGWAQDLDAAREYFADGPLFVIGNEFLDALPVHQLRKTADGWSEIAVDIDGEDLVKAQIPADESLVAQIPQGLTSAMAGSVVEVSPARREFMLLIAGLMRDSGGAGLFFDYGHDRSAAGDTLQAVRDHAFCDVLSEPGEADITSHVDFAELCAAVQEVGGALEPVRAQGDFLCAMGMEMRAEMLADQNPDYASEIASQFTRLTGGNEMGRLFKVMEFSF